MEKEFETAYRALNPAQKQAVDLIDGPLLVIAGPGTGKTQLLSVRVANIIKKTDTDPSSVLCLTFTNSAATNMRERLSQLIGPTAHSVVVRTFHSFAAEIMNLYPDYFWEGARLRIVPDALQLEIIQNLLSQLPLDNPLATKFADNFTAISDIQAALRLTKEAGLTPAKLQAMLSVNEAYIDVVEPKLRLILTPKLSFSKLDELMQKVNALPEQAIDESVMPLSSLSRVIKSSLEEAVTSDQAGTKTAQTGKWKRRWLQNINGQLVMGDERRRLSWWQAFAVFYEKYRDSLHSRGYYDYSDMIIEVITQLEQHPALLADIQERYLYILIDEFQDANAAQIRLSHLVAAHHSNVGRPNIMAVGDDDQSIFAFNGAELNNMLSFQRAYKATKTIVLTENYRSTQAVLDSTATIIAQSEDRLINRLPGLNKNLRGAASIRSGKIERLAYPTREHQFSALSRSIERAWRDDSSQSLAVLARSHDGLKRFASYLQARNVPIRYEQQSNILDLQLIKQLRLLAEAVVAISDGDETTLNYALAELLKHPLWQVPPKALWQLATSGHKRETHWLNAIEKSPNKKLREIATWLNWLSLEAAQEPLAVLVEYILGLRTSKYLTSPIRQYFLDRQPIDNGYLEALSGLNVLRGLINEFVAYRHSEASLKDFVRFMKLNDTLGRTLTDETWFVSSERAVQLMTVHKAKGLEFDTVYIIDGVEEQWQPRRLGRKPPANLPLQAYGEHFDDYARLAYVAASRAKRSLVVASYLNDTKGQPVLVSPLFAGLSLTPTAQKDVQPDLTVLEEGLHWPKLTSANQKALLKPRLSEFSLSATGLLQFLDITNGGPEQFLERQLLRLPQLTTDTMAYGTAIHKALQTAQQLTSEGGFKLTKVIDAYHASLKTLSLPTAAYERYSRHGQQTLTNLLKDLGFRLPKDAQAEVAISQFVSDNVALKGTLDHAQIVDDQLIISDYKTGAPLPSFTTKAQNLSLKAWRHRTQLLFYCLLAETSSRFKQAKTISAQAVYVEAETPKQLILGLSPEPSELRRLSRLIEAVWQRIIHLDFPDTKSYPNNLAGILAFEEDLINTKVK